MGIDLATPVMNIYVDTGAPMPPTLGDIGRVERR
jgi:hypothetical protein